MQGLTLVHFSAQRRRLLWDRGCIHGVFRGCLGGVRGYYGLFRVYFVSGTAQVELNDGRVEAPASMRSQATSSTDAGTVVTMRTNPGALKPGACTRPLLSSI